MTWTFRHYQLRAIDAPFLRWGSNAGNGLIVLPTGTGKSGVIAGTAQRAINTYPGTRIAVVTHVKELIEQNAEDLQKVWPDAPYGVYSSGLKRRDTDAPIIVGGIQSLFRNPEVLGPRHIIQVDEAHLISRKDAGMYRQFFSAMRKLVPGMRILGLTATPYRLDSGLLVDPWKDEPPLFDEIFYEFSILEAIQEGWLSPLTTKAPTERIDVSGVAKRGGEYVESDLQKAVDKDDINRKIVDEIITRSHGRKSWLIFTTGIDHMNHINDLLQRSGVRSATYFGNMGDKRKPTLEAFRSGQITALVSVRVATTGLNVPGIDVIADIQPTMSKSLHVQKLGRGTRPVYASGMQLDTIEERIAAIQEGPKPDCLYLDFAQNTWRHGCLDQIDGSKNPGVPGVAPVKDCPSCEEVIHASLLFCPKCGHEFPKPKPKYIDIPSDGPVTSDQSGPKPIWLPVTDVVYSVHYKRVPDGEEVPPPTLRVTHICGAETVSMFLPFDNPKRGAQWIANKRWSDRATTSFIPERVEKDGKVVMWAAEVAMQNIEQNLRKPGRVLAKKEGKYWQYLAADMSVNTSKEIMEQ